MRATLTLNGLNIKYQFEDRQGIVFLSQTGSALIGNNLEMVSQ